MSDAFIPVLLAGLLLTGLPSAVMVGYLMLLTLLSGRLPAPAPSRQARFVVLVPAHNEAEVIERTVRSLLQLDYPPEQFRVQVVADNCTDATAALAEAAGARVWVRQDDTARGKGYALRFAYAKVLAEGWADAVVVVDADTEASSNLLSAFAARLAMGAGAVQAYYGVLNPDASWRTRLVTIALALFHRLRGRARVRLGTSNKLNGNGMCFSVNTLQRVPHEAFSIAEDLEYGIALTRAGLVVDYADEASVLAEMVSTAQAAQSQRQRWEGGRAQMRQQHGWPLFALALRARSLRLLDQSFELLLPPLSTVLLWVLAFAALGLTAWLTQGWLWAAELAACLLVALIAHVLRGVALSGLGRQGWLTLAAAPAYVVWKLLLRLPRASQASAWVRTTREKSRG